MLLMNGRSYHESRFYRWNRYAKMYVSKIYTVPWECAQIKLKEPFLLQRRSHCSVTNLAHVGEPFIAPVGAISNLQGICCIAPGGAIMVAHTHKNNRAVEGAEGAICLNGSSGSLKSSLSFVCAILLICQVKNLVSNLLKLNYCTICTTWLKKKKRWETWLFSRFFSIDSLLLE